MQAAVPNAQISGKTGRSTSFEVNVNSTEIYSRLKTGAFPDFGEIVKVVQEVAKGGEPKAVLTTQ